MNRIVAHEIEIRNKNPRRKTGVFIVDKFLNAGNTECFVSKASIMNGVLKCHKIKRFSGSVAINFVEPVTMDYNSFFEDEWHPD